jgi:hypothetical protein
MQEKPTIFDQIKNYKFSPSKLKSLMATPKLKSEILSDGAKIQLIELYLSLLTGIKKLKKRRRV